MKNIRIAFVGAGLMAEEHIKAFRAVPDVTIIGLHSRTRARAEALANKYAIDEVFDSVGALYAGTSADLVVIAVPELEVGSICSQVFKHPWVCLIEKPAGYNLTDAQEIAAAADAGGREAYVALNRRHYSSSHAVMRDLESHGGQRLVQVFDQEDSLAALEGGKPERVVENWMYANSIHIIDYLSVFCRGELVDVDHILKWNPLQPGFVMTKLQFASGDIGIYQAVWNGPGPWAVTVATPERRWEMRPLEQAAFQAYKSRKLEPMPTHPWDTEFKPGVRLQAEEAVKAARGEPNNLPTLADGIETMKLVQKIYEA